MCEQDPQKALDELREAVKDALVQSEPYVSKYGAFLMPAECWDRLAVLADSRIAKFDALLKKMEQGAELTPKEIEEAVSFDPEETSRE